MSRDKQKFFFVRGLVRESGHWGGFLERFAAAYPEREVLTLDLPGNGARFRERSPLSISGMTEKMRAEFLAKKGAQNVLFALSLGAMVGFDWLHRYPQDFQAAVLVNTSLRGLSPLCHRLQPRNYGRILRLMLSRDPTFVERSILEMTSENKARFPALTAEWVAVQKARPVSVANAIRQLVAATRFHPPQGKPQAPLLLLNGARDRLVEPACSTAIAQHWGCRLERHPEAGHDLTLDAPDWVLEKVREFP